MAVYGTVREREERERLKQQDEPMQTPPLAIPTWFSWRTAVVATTLASVIGFMAALSSPPGSSTSQLQAAAAKAVRSFDASTANYSAVTSYPWTNVVEPWRTTTLTALAGGVALDDSRNVTWTLQDGNAMHTLHGVRVEFQFTSLGKAKVRWATANDAVSVEGEVMVKYVRREVRTLTDADRERFLDALGVVYSVPTETGLTEYGYGPKYQHISYFARKHLAGAAARDCDHWHDDAGLMVHHMSFTLELEQALQAVDPAVTVPYWDYTIDAHAYGEHWHEQSPIFQDSWFGRARDASTAGHVIAKGRWAYTPVMSDAGSFSNITNAFGLLRSPWNANPTPYVTRHFKVLNLTQGGYPTFPDCGTIYQCFSSKSVAEMNECLNGDTHGPVHVMLGGQWHVGSTQQHAVFHYSMERVQLLVFKNLWRRGFASCDAACDGNSSSCACSCDLAVDADPYEVLAQAGVLHQIDQVTDRIFFDHDDQTYHLQGLGADEESVQWRMILNSLCNPGHVGELYTSNAPADPLFWPIHTSAERLLSWKRIQSHLGLPDGKDFDQSWGYAHPSTTPSDTGVVCDWSGVDGESQALPTCETRTCEGHRADDILPSGDFVGDGASYTNQEFYDWLDPYNEQLPYLYDNFEWDVCDEQGFAMSSSKLDLSKSATRR